MDTIRDGDLVLYHYRDGLTAGELATIERALRDSAALRARYAALCATLAAADAQPAPEADAGLEQRLWQRWERQVDAAAMPHRPPAARRERHRGLRRTARTAVAACALIAALGVGFLLGRQPATVAPPPGGADPVAATDLSARVLDAYVAAHLRETENMVLTAANSDSAALRDGNREIAAGLLESNRLYAQAAARAGNARLANFLRQLEPLLIELANPAPAGDIQASDGLRDYLDRTDLLFQLRATQARMDPQRSTSI